MKKIIAGLLIWTQIAVAGKLQDADFKTEAELISAGATAAQLLNDTKVYVTAGGLNKKLSSAISAGDLGGSGAYNIVTNPGFESGTTGWTASGGATATANATAKGTKSLGYDWDSNAASQTLLSDSITIPNGFQGKDGIAYCNIKTPSGTATHTIVVNDGTNDIGSGASTILSGTTFLKSAYRFVFPSSGTIRIKLASVASNEPEIYIDDCGIELAEYYTSQIVTPWTTVSGITITGTTTNPTKGTTSVDRMMWRRVGTNAEIRYEYVQTGAGTAGSGDYLIALPSGLNIDSTKVSFFTTVIGATYSTENNSIGFAKMGAISNGVMSVVAYDATRVRLMGVASTPSAGTMSSSYYALSNASVSFNITMSVPIAGWSTGSAVNADQTDYDWTSYTPTFTGFGTVTSPECQHSRVASNLLLRCKYTTGTTTATEARISLPSGLTSADTTKIPSIALAGTNSVNATIAGSLTVLIEPSVTYITLGKQSGTENGLVKRNGNDFPSSTTFSLEARIPIQGWSSNQRAPTLVGGVTSNSNSALRIEAGRINCSTSSSITNLFGTSWMTTPSNISSGICTTTLSSGWSAAPACTITAANTGGVGDVTWKANATSATALTILCVSGGVACTGGSDINITCIGPR